ncbi:MAG: hypothetical protein JNM60_08300 [Candidatus Competibacteraceae bacterium]|nr:hypothetical protein [Candidatus Competibacteraceae bacterium]
MYALLGGLLFASGLGAVLHLARRGARRRERERHIRNHAFPKPLLDALLTAHPHLEERDACRVVEALRIYFLVHARTAPAVIGMPSRVVDDLWHAFILDTKSYHAFCKHAFGGYFHHIPAARVTADMSSDAALRRTWRHACLEEKIDPKKPVRLPLLFAIDAELEIANGNVYRLSKPDPASRSAEGGGGGAVGCGGFACQGDGLAGGGSGGDSSCGDGGGGCGGGCGGGGGD